MAKKDKKEAKKLDPRILDISKKVKRIED